MEAKDRRKLSMAQKVLDFSRANPATDPGYVGVVTRLEQAFGRASALAYEQRESTDEERLAVRRRAVIRKKIQQQLRHLARVGEVAAKDRPELTGLFAAPGPNLANRVFATAAKLKLDQASEHQDLLKGLALGETFVAELGAAVAEFGAAGSSANLGRVGHVGARADLVDATVECMELIDALDGFNRARFSANQKQLAAWEAARNVFGPFTRSADTGDDPAVAGEIPPAPDAKDVAA